jgi:hypothetical protein
MQPILEVTLKGQTARALSLRAVVVLSLLLGLGAAQADTTNFVGDFGPALWTLQPDQGNVYFTNSDKDLVLTGPNLPADAVPLSLEGILYNGRLGGGLSVGGTLSFHWDYISADALSDSEGDIAWTPPGGTSLQTVLGQGGPGVSMSGDFPATFLSAGTTNLTFLLTTDTLANKLSGTLIISDFQFHDQVPEPSSNSILAVALLCLGAARWERVRVRC